MNKKTLGIVIGMLVFTTTLSVSATTPEHKTNHTAVLNIEWWSQYAHDAANTGYSGSTAPGTNATFLTTVLNQTSTADCNGSQAVIDGKIYIGFGDGRFFCINAYNGDILWQKQPGELGHISSTPAVANGKLYIGAGNNLVCFNAETGQKLWTFPTGGLVKSSPTVVDDKIFFGSYDQNIYCVNDSGKEVWKFAALEKIFTAPAVVDGKVYCAASSFSIGGQTMVYCLYATNGTEIWEYYRASSPATTCTVVDNKVYIGIFDTLHCLDAVGIGQGTTTRLWFFRITPTGLLTSHAVAKGCVYFGTKISGQDKVYCLNATTGKKLWNSTVGSVGISSTPAVADDKIYTGTNDKYFYCLNANNGQVIWSRKLAETPAAQPAIADGNVWIATKGTKVYGFGANQPPAPPAKPSGPTTGKINVEYTYTTSTTDPEAGQVWYKWNFSGQLSEWLGPYNSGAQVEAKYTWKTPGDYTIKVKAKDKYNAGSDWSPALQVTITEAKPELLIGNITGGLLKVSAEIQNVGDAAATPVNWTIMVTGGIFKLINKNVSDTIPTLQAGSTEIVSVSPIFGLGNVNITVTARAPGENDVTKTVDGFVFFFFVIVK